MSCVGLARSLTSLPSFLICRMGMRSHLLPTALERMNEPAYAEGLEQSPSQRKHAACSKSNSELSFYSRKEKFYAMILACREHYKHESVENKACIWHSVWLNDNM